MGILDQYKKQLEEDRKNENDNFSEDFNIEVDEDYKEQYKKELHKQRADIFDNEKQYTERINNTLVRLHEDEKSANLIKNEDVDRIIVKHFYCPECGKELVSKALQCLILLRWNVSVYMNVNVERDIILIMPILDLS